jgi:TonB family protein
MSADTRPLLKILPWLLASAAAHAVLLVNWPNGDETNSNHVAQAGALQVQLIRGVDVVAQPVQTQPVTELSVARTTRVVAAPEAPRTPAAQRPSIPTNNPSSVERQATIAQPSPANTISASLQNAVADNLDTRSRHATDRSELMALLHAAIDRNKRYPQSALRMGREGSTRVDFNLGPDGRIEVLNIGNSSGVHALDIAATRAVQNIAPFPMADRYLDRTQRFQVDVVFQIN